jgi:monoamine oxidase
VNEISVIHARVLVDFISNDLWPYPEELGFDFLKDVWKKIPRQLQERLAAAQAMYLTSFNFEEIVAGRTEIRHYLAAGTHERGRKKELELAKWIKKRRTSLKSLKNRLEAYKKKFRNENDGVSKMLDDVRERLVKVNKTWEAKRKRD